MHQLLDLFLSRVKNIPIIRLVGWQTMIVSYAPYDSLQQRKHVDRTRLIIARRLIHSRLRKTTNCNASAWHAMVIYKSLQYGSQGTMGDVWSTLPAGTQLVGVYLARRIDQTPVPSQTSYGNFSLKDLGHQISNS